HRRQAELLIRTDPAWETEEKKGRWWRRVPLGKMLRWLRPVALLGPVCLLLSAMYMEAPRYRAEATLLIDTPSEHSPGGYDSIARSVPDSGKDNDRTYYALLRNRNLASLVIREQGLELLARRDEAQRVEPAVAAHNNQTGDSSTVNIQAIEAYLNDL